jgi:hypothetical protein
VARRQREEGLAPKNWGQKVKPLDPNSKKLEQENRHLTGAGCEKADALLTLQKNDQLPPVRLPYSSVFHCVARSLEKTSYGERQCNFIPKCSVVYRNTRAPRPWRQVQEMP